MTYKVTVTEDVTDITATGNTTSINLTGQQTEISVVNPAKTVTYDPTLPFTATNVQDALPQAYKMLGETDNDFDVHLQFGNSFAINSGSNSATFGAYGGVGGFAVDISSTGDILLRNDNNNALFLSDGSAYTYDTLYAEFSGSQAFFATKGSQGSIRKHYSLKSGFNELGALGLTSDSMYLGSQSCLLKFTGGAYVTHEITPISIFFAPQSGLVNLGADNAKFKSLYLSDNLYAEGVEFEDGDITFRTGAFAVKSQYSVNTITSDNSSVSLYFNGNEKFKTTPNGVQVSGNITTQANGSDDGDITASGAIECDGGAVINHNGAKITTSTTGVTLGGSTVMSGNSLTAGNAEVIGQIYTPKIESINSDIVIESTDAGGKVEIKGTTAGGTTHTNFIADGDSATMKSASSAFGKVHCSGTYVQVSGFFQPLNGILFDTVLDDYEEGTWTPTLNSNGITFTNGSTYQRIGNTVTLFLRVSNISHSSSIDMSVVGGYPFAPISSNYRTVGAYTAQQVVGVCWLGDLQSLTVINFEADDGVMSGDNDWLYATITYETDA